MAGNDRFVLFIASHGMVYGDQHYILTHDYRGRLEGDALISTVELLDIAKRLPALDQVYILDTCHAGAVGPIVEGLYDARLSVLAKSTGMHLFSSASSKEQALEGYRENGLFAHALLAGLDDEPKADRDADRVVSVVELGGYAKRLTESLASGLGHRQTPLIIDFGRDAPVYRIERHR